MQIEPRHSNSTPRFEALQLMPMHLCIGARGKRRSPIWIAEPLLNGFQLGMRTSSLSLKASLMPSERSVIEITHKINGGRSEISDRIVAEHNHPTLADNAHILLANLTFVTLRSHPICTLPTRQEHRPVTVLDTPPFGYDIVVSAYLCSEESVIPDDPDNPKSLIGIWCIGKASFLHLYRHVARPNKHNFEPAPRKYPGLELQTQSESGVINIATFSPNAGLLN